jgi:sarcosine oxidase
VSRSVSVVGGGSIGAQVAWRLVEAGLEVTVYDRYAPPHGQGAHAGESRLLRSVPFLETAPGDAEILAASSDAWAELAARSGQDLVTRCGALIVGPQEDERFRLARDELRRRSGTVEPAAALRARFPQLELIEGEDAVFDPLGGLVDPQRAVAAALDLARSAGAVVCNGVVVRALTPGSAGVTLDLGHTTQVVDRVVVATGAFGSELLPALPVRARRLLLGWFRPRRGQEGLLAGMPTFVHSPVDGPFQYGGPSYDGRTVKVGIDWPWGSAVDAATADRSVSAADLQPMLDAVERRFPWLDPDPDRVEMHVDGWSVDEHGILGPWPDDERIVLATGWSGHGFKISPVLGAIVADLVTGTGTRFDITHLDPARFAAVVGT